MERRRPSAVPCAPMLRILLTTVAVAMGLFTDITRASVGPAHFDRLIVFGDSLSDTGNAGRFSNGPVWVEYLARAFDATIAPARTGGTNFAVGGARTRDGSFSLRAQADLFLAQVNGDARALRTLYIVYGGANDIRGAAHATDRPAVVATAVAALRSIIDDLAEAGANEVLVPNIPDIGRTPEARALGPTWMRDARELTIAFNARLEEMLDAVEAQQRVRIIRLDIFALVERAAANPARFGLRNMTDPCLGANADHCDDYAFWDNMHPTTAGHARLAEAALSALRAADR